MYQRWAESKLLDCLDFIDVTILAGPRQAGKTTLCQSLAQRRGMPYLTMDNPQDLEHATSDPLHFFKTYPRGVIDEIQRVPELILPLKHCVDENRSPGRYIITGSVDLWGSGIAPDSLAGRAQIIQLLPLSWAELRGQAAGSLIDEMFQGNFSTVMDETIEYAELARVMMAGGYPYPNIQYHRPSERTRWLLNHVGFIATHDLSHLEDVRKKERFPSFIEYVSQHSAQLMNLSTCGTALEITHQTVQRWLGLLEHMFVIKRLPAWHKSVKRRLAKAPKYHFLDTGLCLALQRVNHEELLSNRALMGRCLENYVFTEIAKRIASSEDRTQMFHYRDHNRYEVDLVLQRGQKVVGIEVKLSGMVTLADFSGLKRLQEASGDGFVCGVVLYPGAVLQSRGDRLFAVPLSWFLKGGSA